MRGRAGFNGATGTIFTSIHIVKNLVAASALVFCATTAQAVNLYIFTISGTGSANAQPLAAQSATVSFTINADPLTGGAAPDWNFAGVPSGALTSFTSTVISNGGASSTFSSADLLGFNLNATPTTVTGFSYAAGANGTFPRVRIPSNNPETSSNWRFVAGSGGFNRINWDVANATIQQVTDIPEPEALASTLAAAVFGLVALRRRRKERTQA